MTDLRVSQETRTRTVRAVAHVHSEWSADASWSLSRIAATFGRWRDCVVLMSEHSRGFSPAKWQEYAEACAAASTRHVTLVPGIEYGDADDVVHIPVWGHVPFFGEAPDISTLLMQVTEAGGTAVWAHPMRKDAWQRFDPRWREHLRAIEVWNRKYDGIAPNRHSVELRRQHQAQAFTALDFHTGRQLFPLSLALQLTRPAGEDMGERSGAVSVDEAYAALSADRFSARALGLPVDLLTGGLPAAALGTMEAGRRTAARVVHQWI
jgi:hypothetical protein